MIRKDRESSNGKKTGGEVLMCIKEKFCVEEDVCYLKYPTDAIAVTMKRQFMKAPKIIALYRPPSTSESVFLTTLEQQLSYSQNLESYILGDYNSNIESTNTQIVHFKTLKKQYGFEKLINHKTRITSASATTIDLILANNRDKVVKSGVLPCSASDHELIFRIRKHKTKRIKNNSEQKIVTCRPVSSTKAVDKTKEILKSAPWWALDN